MQGRYFNISGGKWFVKRNFKTLQKNIIKLIFVPLLILIRSQGSTKVRLFMIKPKHHRRFARFVAKLNTSRNRHVGDEKANLLGCWPTCENKTASGAFGRDSFTLVGGGSPFKPAKPNSLTLLQKPSSKKGEN